ncbi:hypothetical protein PoB_005881300 [Plakobranchus ocellatus]|uniref:DDE-1 domain-containing protein n=1 Tax=Plakobranchus ocellatus TaxID=259542 RepID=A0AAV4CM36_9GAST|nr:hypothetical protein PoB_005881300 [Plakobranchus ocellatus]
MENEPDLLSKIIFSDEATVHLRGKMNRHIVKIWGTQNPHATLEFESDSPKVNVFCAITEGCVETFFSLKYYPSLALLWPRCLPGNKWGTYRVPLRLDETAFEINQYHMKLY